jgi:aspartyl-tRNA(Asn)/glutamyl-tRNA(Gln) amidotransferase subunit A
MSRPTLAQLQADVAAGRATSVQLVTDLLERIDATEDALNAYTVVGRDSALAVAAELDAAQAAGELRGPLHGIPISVKDLLDTADLPTSAGGKPRGSGTPETDAAVVTRLREAGAVIVGKTNTHEYAYGYTTVNPHHGDTHNPWDVARTAGGSSGGSGASVAAGSAIAAIGSDTGGSIRVPASFCGIFGIKPTFGRVSRAGVFPLAWTLDHVGPLTQSAEDAAIMLGAIAGPDPADATTLGLPPVEDYRATLADGIEGLRVGVPSSYFFDDIDAEVLASVRAAIAELEALGAVLVPVDIAGLDAAVGAWLSILLAEATVIHEAELRFAPEDYGADVRLYLEAGAAVSAAQYLRAQRAREQLADAFAVAMRDVDVVVTPATAVPAQPLGQGTVTIGDLDEALFLTLARISAPLDLVGLPAASVPCGLTSAGLPIGLQVIGHPFAEATVLRAAHAYEQRRGPFALVA